MNSEEYYKTYIEPIVVDIHDVLKKLDPNYLDALAAITTVLGTELSNVQPNHSLNPGLHKLAHQIESTRLTDINKESN